MGIFGDILARVRAPATAAVESAAGADVLAKDALAYENAAKFLNFQGANVPADKEAAINAAMQGGWQAAPVRLNAKAKQDFYQGQELGWKPPAPPAPIPRQGPGQPARIVVQPGAPIGQAPVGGPGAGSGFQTWPQATTGRFPLAQGPMPPAGVGGASTGPGLSTSVSNIVNALPQLPSMPPAGVGGASTTLPSVNALGVSTAGPGMPGGHGATRTPPTPPTPNFRQALVQAKAAAKPPSILDQQKAAFPELQFVRPKGGAGGHVEGGFFKDPSGQEYYLKTEKDRKGAATGEQLARNEALANELYRVAGAVVPEIEIRGPHIKTKVFKNSTTLSGIPFHIQNNYDKAIQEDIAADAWVANWDVHGGNILVDPNDPKRIMRIDQGGALDYTGWGDPKTASGMGAPAGVGLEFSSGAERDVSAVKYEDAIRKATPAQWKAAADKLAKIKRSDVETAVDKYGPADPQARANLVNLMMRRRANLMEQFNQTAIVLPPQQGLKHRQAKFGEQTKMFGRARGAALTMQEQGTQRVGGFHPAFGTREEAEAAFPFAKQDVKELVGSTRDYMRYDAKGAQLQLDSQGLKNILQEAKAKYYPGIVINNVLHNGKPQTIFINLDAPLLRDARAVFDPTKMHLDHLLASGAAVAVGAAAYTLAGGGEAQAEEAKEKFRYIVRGGNEWQVPVDFTDAQADKYIKEQEAKEKPEFRTIVRGANEWQVPAGFTDAQADKYIKEQEEKDKIAATVPVPEEDTWLLPERKMIGAGREEVFKSGAELIEAIRGQDLQDPPGWVARLVDRDPTKQPWTEGEKRTWKALSGFGDALGGFTTMIAGLTPGVARTAEWAHSKVDQSDDSPEAKEVEHAAVDVLFSGGIGGVTAKVKKITALVNAARARMAASTRIAKFRRGYRGIFRPDQVDDDSRAAAQLILEKTGEAKRSTSASMAALRDDAGIKGIFDNNERLINKLTPQEQLDLIDYMQRRSQGAVLRDPELQAFADEFRNAMNQREIKLSQTPALANAHMQEDYVSQYWKDPNAAAKFLKQWRAKQGHGGALKAKFYPSYADGINAGLVPLTTNPIEIGWKYMDSMDRFIAHTEIIEAGRASGKVKMLTPGSKLAHQWEAQGWRQLEGRMAERRGPQGQPLHAYAPEGWALPYNNTVSRGVYAHPEWQGLYDRLIKTENASVALMLGFSAWHFTNMMFQSVASRSALMGSQFAGAIEMGTKGDLWTALKLLGGSARAGATMLAAPVTTYRRGRKAGELYLNRLPATRAKDKLIVDEYTATGGEFGGKLPADYTFTAAGTWFDSFKRGTIKKDFVNSFGSQHLGAALAEHVGKIIQTTTQPLFEHYIPAMKLGAFSENLHAFLRANPSATAQEIREAAIKINNSIDNRFGELVRDRLFWNAGMRQFLTPMMLSFSYTFGTLREVGGGALQGVNLPKGLKRLSISNKDYDPRVGYVMGLPFALFMVGNAYSWLKTGAPPKNFEDALDNTWGPKTGATVPGVGGRGEVPERTILPGDIKDIYGWWDDYTQEGYNKLGPAWHFVFEAIMTGKDWQGRDIRLHDWSDVPGWLNDWYRYMQNYQPIGVQQFEKGEKPGSRITPFESFMGVRPAPAWISDPRGLEAVRKRHRQLELKQRTRQDVRQENQQLYGGPNE